MIHHTLYICNLCKASLRCVSSRGRLSKKTIYMIYHMLYGFSLVCTLMCLVKLEGSLNDLEHIVHSLHTVPASGLAPVCILLCRNKLEDVLNELSHSVHL